MSDIQKLSARESMTINIIKAISILSVLSAHLVSFSSHNLFTRILSSFWVLFGEVGVIAFFIVGGFLYVRHPHDNKPFWKKKFFRIIIPWFVCSLMTYSLCVYDTRHFSISAYLKWILGSGTWYYYITMYTLFLFIFKWFYNNNKILLLLIAVQVLSLVFKSFGMSTTISLGFFTDYLNPLHWIGYFSLGILIRKYRLDLKVRNPKYAMICAYALAIVSFCILSYKEIFTYFNILSSVFCLSSVVIVADISYRTATFKKAEYIGRIGTWSYCIYLLHMQIVQIIIWKIPNDTILLLFSPLLGLALMVVLISIGLFICSKLPHGDKIKGLFGL